MIKNNNKGYLLTETIIAITVVATVITVVYAITMNYYIKQDNEVTKYNTSQGLYNANQIKKLCSSQEESYINRLGNNNFIDITDIDSNFSKFMDIKHIYFSKADLSGLLNSSEKIPTSIKNHLKNTKKDTYKCDYKYVIIYNDNSYTTVGTNCDE